MDSIPGLWAEINAYVSSIGPERERPPRPARCVICGFRRVWFDGWRSVFAIVLAGGVPVRFDDGLALQRVKCAWCRVSWTLRPRFLQRCLSFQPDVVEAAVVSYLSTATATYRAVAGVYRCSPSSIWRWVGRVAGTATPGEIIAAAARIQPATPAPHLIPRTVPEAHPKAWTESRYAVLLLALQSLAAMVFWARAQVFPPDDPSPLRLWCIGRLRDGSCVVSLATARSPPNQHEVPDPPE